MGNGYALDCEPIGSGSCGFPEATAGAAQDGGRGEHTEDGQGEARRRSLQQDEEGSGPEYGFYCYNPWAFYMVMHPLNPSKP
jgi:hypothetical protein